MAKTTNITQKRTADAHRIRGLWVASVRAAPDMTEEDRIKQVALETRRRTPAGTYMYLNSFPNSEPSDGWLVAVLRGRMPTGAVLGDSLISEPVKRRTSGSVWDAIHHLEACVKAIADGLGVELPPKSHD